MPSRLTKLTWTCCGKSTTRFAKTSTCQPRAIGCAFAKLSPRLVQRMRPTRRSPLSIGKFAAQDPSPQVGIESDPAADLNHASDTERMLAFRGAAKILRLARSRAAGQTAAGQGEPEPVGAPPAVHCRTAARHAAHRNRAASGGEVVFHSLQRVTKQRTKKTNDLVRGIRRCTSVVST